MTDPLRLLHVSPSFFPAVAYGGPILSTKAITDAIARRPGYRVEVLSTDTADPNSRARLDLPQNPLPFPAGYPVRYCRSVPGTSISAELLRRLPGAVRRADVVHLTGPYNFPVLPTLVACRLSGTPLVWSPRGGFQATAEWGAAPKRRLKSAFERLSSAVGPRHFILHATAPVEAEIIARNFRGASCALIPNAVDIPEDLPDRIWRPEGRLRLAFLSRVHPKKGLDILIPAMVALPDHVTLDIYGDGEARYLKELRTRIAELGLTDRIRFHGHADGAAKSRAFTEADLFVLPTHSENFGIVVAEALAHGTPAVTTVHAPWAGLETRGCGRQVEATIEALVAAIEDLATRDLARLGEIGRDWVAADFSISGMAQEFDRLYRSLADGHRPTGEPTHV